MSNSAILIGFILFGTICHFCCKEKTANCNELSGMHYKTYEEVVLAIKSKTYKFQDSVLVENGKKLKLARYFTCNGTVGYMILTYFQKPDDYRCEIPMSIWREFKASDRKEAFFEEKIASNYVGKITISNIDSQKYEYSVCQ